MVDDAAAAPIEVVKEPVTFMSDESANTSAHTPPRCPICAQPMRLVRKTLRFHGLPELYTFECRTCDVSLTQERSVQPS